MWRCIKNDIALNIEIFLLNKILHWLFFEETYVNLFFYSGESVGHIKLIKTKHAESFKTFPPLFRKM